MVYSKQKTINCNGKLLNLECPAIMGILNSSKESFFDGGRYQSDSELLSRAVKLIGEGAQIIDIGVMSTKPGAPLLEVREEAIRAVHVTKLLRAQFPNTILSIDTQRTQVVIAAADQGIDMVNDISGGNFDQTMFTAVAELKLPYILTHIQGNPKTMQNNPSYEDVVMEVMSSLAFKLHQLRSLGVNDIIVDPGFGFGKTIEQNFKLLNEIDSFQVLNAPVMVGLSRKGMIHKSLDTNPEGALNGSTALHAIALYKGADILRVHDVREAKEVVKLIQKLKSV